MNYLSPDFDKQARFFIGTLQENMLALEHNNQDDVSICLYANNLVRAFTQIIKTHKCDLRRLHQSIKHFIKCIEPLKNYESSIARYEQYLSYLEAEMKRHRSADKLRTRGAVCMNMETGQLYISK